MSPGILGNRVSSMRIPTEKPKTFCPPFTLIPSPACRSPWLVELSELLPRLPQLSFYRFVVGGVGEFRQIALPVAEAALELAHVGPREAAISPLLGRPGVEHEEPVDHADDA